MPSAIPKNQHDKRNVKAYILDKYLYRQGDLKSICFADDDSSDNNLHNILVGLNPNQRFENLVEDLINSAIRTGKLNKLVTLLQEKDPRFERQLTDSSISSPATKPAFDTTGQNNKQWAKSSQPRRYSSTYQQEPTNHPQIEKLHQDIEQLEQDISSLGEIDALLEDLRRKIGDLLLNSKVKHRMMQDESAVAANRTNVFQSNQESSFLLRKQRQSFSSPSSWRESPYAKSN